jgi:hypothetical protein
VKRTESNVVVVTYSSDLHPEVTSTSDVDGPVIEWADANPVAWKIVTTHRSAPFGKKSSTYMGWAQGKDTPAAVIHRLTILREVLTGDKDDFWRWRARFTMEHYHDKSFKGGFFKQFDEKYSRGCCDLDYTTSTREQVIDRFLAWCDVGCKFPTREVRIDDKTVRRFDEEGRRI